MGNLTPFPARPNAPAIMAILSRFNREKIDAFVEIAIELADAIDGDPDGEEDDPAEADGTERDAAWIEWTTMRGSQKRSPNIAPPEGDEEDDPSGQYDEDDYTGPLPRGYGAGCSISDPGDEEPDREPPEGCPAIYGIDQTKGPLPPFSGGV